MRFVNVRELRLNSNRVLRGLSQEDMVVTKHGKPVAAITYLDEDLLDAYLIAHHPTLLKEMERDVDLWKKGRLKTLTLEQVKERILGRRDVRKKRLA